MMPYMSGFKPGYGLWRMQLATENAKEHASSAASDR